MSLDLSQRRLSLVEKSLLAELESTNNLLNRSHQVEQAAWGGMRSMESQVAALEKELDSTQANLSAVEKVGREAWNAARSLEGNMHMLEQQLSAERDKVQSQEKSLEDLQMERDRLVSTLQGSSPTGRSPYLGATMDVATATSPLRSSRSSHDHAGAPSVALSPRGRLQQPLGSPNGSTPRSSQSSRSHGARMTAEDEEDEVGSQHPFDEMMEHL